MTFTRRTTLPIIGTLMLLGLIGVCYRASHVFFPEHWLPASAERFQPSDTVKRVDPKIYDQEWFDAARAGRGDISEVLLKAGFPVDTHTNAGYTALVLATYHGHNDEVTLLLRAGANPCLPDHNGNTALMGALFKGETAVARLLLGSCPIDQTNNSGQTALSFAALFGRLDMIPELVAHGADAEHIDAKGYTALAIVLNQDNAEAAAALRSVGAKR